MAENSHQLLCKKVINPETENSSKQMMATESPGAEPLKMNLPLFRNFDPNDSDPEISEIESLCMACYQEGTTRILLTKIPFYREVILMSFSCPHCHYSNNEIQSSGKIQDRGVIYKVKLQTQSDFNRQVVKSDLASITIPELQFEIPPETQKGEVTTIEGIIEKSIRGLKLNQEERKKSDLTLATKIDKFIEQLRQLRHCNQDIHVILNDPGGNSFIENPRAPLKDENMTITWYKRTAEQNNKLGFDLCTAEDENKAGPLTAENLGDEVLSFPANCYNCNSPCETNMKVVDVPHFKQVVVMATVCDLCGYKTNEVKGGAGIESKGTRIKLHITSAEDMKRDLLKSDTCYIEIPELEFELEAGSLGGKFTTVEGLLVNIKEQLLENNQFSRGDAANSELVEKLKTFGNKLDKVISCETLVHLILDDPAGNSYLQNIYAPDQDSELEIVTYERTFDQNEALGLNDMRTENYQNTS